MMWVNFSQVTDARRAKKLWPAYMMIDKGMNIVGINSKEIINSSGHTKRERILTLLIRRKSN